jgi:transposase
MNGDQLQVGLDISQKRLDVCTMRANGEVLLNHRSFANNRHGYEALKQMLLGQISENGFTGLDIGAESTGYYWLPLFLQLQADESWQEHEQTLYLLNSRQVYWFKKEYAPDAKSDARDSIYVTEKLRL